MAGSHSITESDTEELFLLQTRVNISPRDPHDWSHDQSVQFVAVGLPICLLLFGASCVLVEAASFNQNVRRIILMISCGIMIVGSEVCAMEILKLAPRAIETYPVICSFVDIGIRVIGLPIGLYYHSFAETEKLLRPIFILTATSLVALSVINHSLAFLSVTTYMLVFQTMPMVLYPLEIEFLGERFSFAKLFMVVLTMIALGIILVEPKSSVDGVQDQLIGYILCFAGVVIYALYEILYVLWVPDLGKSSAQHITFLFLFFGIGGFFLCVAAVLVAALRWGVVGLQAGYLHDFGDFPNRNELMLLVGSAMCEWIHIIATFIAISKFSPAWVGMVMSLQIPLSFCIDKEFNNLILSRWTSFAMLILVFAVCGFTYLTQLKIGKDLGFDRLNMRAG